MKYDVQELIDGLDELATLQDEAKTPDHLTAALHFQLASNCLRRYRDTLISIANCQNGIASHQAQGALTSTGHCSHFNNTYRAQLSGKANAWFCSDCGRASPERLVPFE